MAFFNGVAFLIFQSSDNKGIYKILIVTNATLLQKSHFNSLFMVENIIWHNSWRNRFVTRSSIPNL